MFRIQHRSYRFALNELQSRLEHSPPVLDFQSLKVHILDTNIEYGILKTNDKILGLWTPKCIKQEVMIGMIDLNFNRFGITNLYEKILMFYIDLKIDMIFGLGNDVYLQKIVLGLSIILIISFYKIF